MTTQTADPPEVDLDGGLFGRRSVLGGLLILGLITLFSTGLTALDDFARNADGFKTGETVTVAPGVEFAPAGGWTKDPDLTVAGLSVVAAKNGWEIKISGIKLPEGQTVESFADLYRATDDPAVQVTDLETFTTASGETGVTWETHGSNAASVNWLIANDAGDAVLVLSDGSASNLDSVERELTDMATSVTIAGAGQ